MRAPIRGLLLDIDGVITQSWHPLPGAVEAVATLRARDVPMRFLTNTTTRPRAAIGAALRDAGLGIDDGEILTATVVTAGFLRDAYPGARCLLLDSGAGREDLAGVTLAPAGGPADVVVVGSGGPELTWDALNRALRALVAGAPLVAMHGSAAWRTDEGLCLDGGAYVAGLERAAGVTATVVGKPAPLMFERALAALGLRPPEVAMVGDDLVADVLAAQTVGCVGVLVRTGKFRADTLAAAPRAPDAVLDSIADLVAWLMPA